MTTKSDSFGPLVATYNYVLGMPPARSLTPRRGGSFGDLPRVNPFTLITSESHFYFLRNYDKLRDRCRPVTKTHEVYGSDNHIDNYDDNKDDVVVAVNPTW